MHDFSLLSIIPSLFSNQTKLAVFPFCLFKRLSFHSFFLSYVRTETHTAADMHKLSHRCLTRQYEHIDISISLRFYSHSFLFFFLSGSGFIHEKVSFGLMPETEHKDKIFYWGEWKFVGKKSVSPAFTQVPWICLSLLWQQSKQGSSNSVQKVTCCTNDTKLPAANYVVLLCISSGLKW